MVSALGGVCAATYIWNTTRFASRDILARPAASASIEAGELATYIAGLGREMGLRETVALRELPRQPIHSLQSPYSLTRHFESFGNRFSGNVGVAYLEGFEDTPTGVGDISFNRNHTKFFLARQIAQIANGILFAGTIAALVTGIVVTWLSLSTFPILGYIFGAAAGAAVQGVVQYANEYKIEEAAIRHTSPEVRRATLDLFVALRDRETDSKIRLELTTRSNRIQRFIEALSPQTAPAPSQPQ